MKRIIHLLQCGLLLPGGWLLAQEAAPLFLPPPGGYEVVNVESLNSPFLDYCAVPFADGVVFTSARGNKAMFACDEDMVSGKYSDLFFAEKDVEGNFFPPELLQGDVNGQYHDGTATFTANESRMIFSRNNRKGKNSRGMIDLKIYAAGRKRNSWANAVELPINSDDFATCHPTLSADGRLMFFASDRPGGYGGMDLYVVRMNGDAVSDPVNLGPEVNTPGNEIFPFMGKNGMLYFASNGHPGLGGLDVFFVPMDGMQPGQRTRLPAPVNTPYDDFAFTVNEEETEGYLTSNRPGGKGLDDIYSWRGGGPKMPTANLCVVVKGTGERIEDAILDIRPLGYARMVYGNSLPDLSALQLAPVTIQGKQYYVLAATSATGLPPVVKSCGLLMPVLAGERYTIVAQKDGYEPVEMEVTAEELTAEPEFLVEISKAPAVETPKEKVAVPVEAPVPAWKNKKVEAGAVIRLDNVYYDFDKFDIRSDAAEELDKVVDWMKKYPTLEIELGSHTDARGSDEYNMRLSQKRAESAVAYLISRGIAGGRLKAQGYGETHLVNQCADGVECTDGEHQDNRRTEIKITRLDEPGVRVED